jgi:carbonic anhydrase
MARITERSQVIAELVDAGKFKIVGGIYNLHTGTVDFFE